MDFGVPPESYYNILGLNSASSTEEIRRAYRKLAMQWHPDKWANNPAMLGEAKRKFQKIQEAYTVLSDPRKKTLYDAGIYDRTDEDEGLCDFMQELTSLMSQVREEEKTTSMEELQSMFAELVQGFQTPQWYANSPVATNQGCTGKIKQQAESIQQDSTLPNSNFGALRMSSYCR
ncbi:DnaJ-like protein subfamily B member 8 [Bienertia sinuspersici]